MDQFPSIVTKKKSESRLVSSEGFPQIGSVHYFDLLEKLHKDIQPKTYFEIGTESGASLSLANCTSYAVDPKFKLKADVTGAKDAVYLFQGTSDDFFASDLATKMKPKLDFAFLDGMHLFEYLLRDFINCEKLMAKNGQIAMHDCVPFNFLAAERVWNKRKTKSWTGDVWKVVAILKEFRTDLTIDVYDVKPSGLVVIGNLDPKNTTLEDNYGAIEKKWLDVSLEEYGLDRLNDMLNVQPFQIDFNPPDMVDAMSKKKR